MKTKVRTLAIAVSVLAAIGLVSAAKADTGMKFDAEADFESYATYGWILDTEKPEGSPLAPGAATDTQIRNAIDAQLRDQGFEQAVGTEPDFLISYDGALEPILDIESERRQITEGVAWVVEGSIRSYYRGTLVITITPNGAESPAWTGWTTEKVKNRGNVEGKIKKAVRKILRQFPPDKD